MARAGKQTDPSPRTVGLGSCAVRASIVCGFTLAATLQLSATGRSFADEPSLQQILASPGVKVHLFQCDQGQAVGLQLPDMRRDEIDMLDEGPLHAFPLLDAQLKSIGVRRIRNAWVNHVHYDHAGGLAPLGMHYPIENLRPIWHEDSIPLTAAVWMANARPDIAAEPSERNRANYHLAVADEKHGRVEIGKNAHIEVLWPPEQCGGQPFPDQNYTCQALVARYTPPNGERAASFLACGDLMHPVQEILATDRLAQLDVDFGIAAHHGTGMNTSFRFAQALRGGPSDQMLSADRDELRQQLRNGTEDGTLSHLAEDLKLLVAAHYRARKHPDSALEQAGYRRLFKQLREQYGESHAKMMASLAERQVQEYGRRLEQGRQIPVMMISSGLDNPYGHPNADIVNWLSTEGGFVVQRTTDSHRQRQHIIRYRRTDDAGNFVDKHWRTHVIRDRRVLPAVQEPDWLDEDGGRPYDYLMRLTNGIFELSRAHHEHVVTAGELPRFASASREHAKGLFLDAARAIYRGRTRAMDHSAEEGPAAAIQRLLEQHHDLLATPLFSEPRLTVASYYGFFPAEPKHFAKRIWHDPAPYGAGYVSDYGKGTTTHTNDRRRPARASRTHPPDSRAAGRSRDGQRGQPRPHGQP
jgi:beta-lactamase superfamily II metal-dependent hydrolase